MFFGLWSERILLFGVGIERMRGESTVTVPFNLNNHTRVLYIRSINHLITAILYAFYRYREMSDISGNE